MKNHQQSDHKRRWTIIKILKKNMRKISKKMAKGWSGTLPQGARNTIRSKIEDKLTEEKLKDGESVAYASTPWASSGPERIVVAYGKVPLQARAGEDVCENTYFLAVVSRKT